MVQLKDSVNNIAFANLDLFQFHIGSIKSDTYTSNPDMRPINRFNSTLVQLKDCAFHANNLFLISFNSTLVQLKEWIDFFKSADRTKFQFHIGSIKSWTFRHFPMSVKRWFQFHIGSIKSVLIFSFKTRAFRFQFHIGSIKSQTHALATSPLTGVSIPHWFN